MAIARVNNTTGDVATTVDTIVTTSLNCTAGNFLVAGIVQTVSAARTLTSINDTAGNTYRWGPPTRYADGAVIGTMQLAYTYNMLGNAGNQLTIVFDTTANNGIEVIVAQYSGVMVSGDPYDTEGTAASGTGGATTGSFTPAASGNLIVSVGSVVNNTGGFTAGSGFSVLQSYDNATIGISMAFQDIINSGNTSQTAAITSSHAGSSIGLIAAVFKAAAGGGGGSSHNALTLVGVG